MPCFFSSLSSCFISWLVNVGSPEKWITMSSPCWVSWVVKRNCSPSSSVAASAVSIFKVLAGGKSACMLLVSWKTCSVAKEWTNKPTRVPCGSVCKGVYAKVDKGKKNERMNKKALRFNKSITRHFRAECAYSIAR